MNNGGENKTLRGRTPPLQRGNEGCGGRRKKITVVARKNGVLGDGGEDDLHIERDSQTKERTKKGERGDCPFS